MTIICLILFASRISRVNQFALCTREISFNIPHVVINDLNVFKITVVIMYIYVFSFFLLTIVIILSKYLFIAISPIVENRE